MKQTLILCILLFVASVSAMAVLPLPFDPRTDEQTTIEGSCYLLQPMPFSSNYLIVTLPWDRNPKHEWFTAEAKADQSVKVIPGQFVWIKAVRIKPTISDTAPLKIMSIRPITKW